jgi:Ca2+/Na+ antiporter
MDWLQSPQFPPGLIAMLGGVALLYAAAQSLGGVIAQTSVDSPGRRALWHAGPIAAAAIAAMCLGHGEMALAMLTGSSVAALSLAPGVCRVISSSRYTPASYDPFGKLLLAPALLLWLIGKHAEIDWLTGTFLAVQAILFLWIGWDRQTLQRFSFWTCIIFVLASGVAAVAMVLALHGAVLLKEDLSTLTPGIFAAGVIAPVLILPLLGESVRLTEEHRASEARSMQIALATINLTAVIPLCVLISYLGPHLFPWLSGGALAFPLGTWRVDCVALIILAAWNLSDTIPSRWPGSIKGVLLILFYGAYLLYLARADLYL